MQALLHATAHNTLNEMIVSTLDCTRMKNRSTVFSFSLESINIKFVKRSFMRFQWICFTKRHHGKPQLYLYCNT